MQCRECHGRGVVLIDCEHDDEWGVDTCWACVSDGGKIESECLYCDGFGTVSTCDGCGGGGCGKCDYNGVLPAS